VSTPAHREQTLIEKIQSLPSDRITEVEDFVDFLRERSTTRSAARANEPMNFPVDELGPWPEALTLHREDLYADDGR
jgi:hypothetical protein